MKNRTKKGIERIIEKRSKQNDKITNLYFNKEALDYGSFIPQSISFLTGCIGVYYYVNRPNDIFLTLFFMGVCVCLLFFCEHGIRFFTISGVERFFDGQKPILNFLLVLFLGSFTSVNSYTCGSYIIGETSTPPTLSYSSKVDSIEKSLIVVSSQIDQAINTTWKGRTTREATKMLNKSLYPERDRLNKELSAIKTKEDQLFESNLIAFNAKNTNYGFITGSVGVFCTILSIIMLILKERSEHQIIEMIEEKTGRSMSRVGKSIDFAHLESYFNDCAGKNDERLRVNDERLPKSIGFLRSIDKFSEKKTISDSDETKVDSSVIVIDKSRQKECLYCGSVFEYKNSSAKYCSDRCRTNYNNEKRKVK